MAVGGGDAVLSTDVFRWAFGAGFLVITFMLGLLIKMVRDWTRMEDKLTGLGSDMVNIVKDKDNTHRQMLSMIEGLDRRVRFIEEWRMKRNGSNP